MSAPAVPDTSYNGAKRFCLCKKEINLASKQTRSKCSKCCWNFCSSDCRKKYKKEHAVNCATNSGLRTFYKANESFFFVFGAWLKSREDNTDYVGMRVDIDNPSADVRAAPFNKQSLDILLQKVHGRSVMYKAGYPDVFIVMIAWEGTMVCFELDLVKPTPLEENPTLANAGRILLGDSPLFDDKNAGLFIVPLAEAARGEKRTGWMKSFMENRERPVVDVPRPYTGFQMWRDLGLSKSS